MTARSQLQEDFVQSMRKTVGTVNEVIAVCKSVGTATNLYFFDRFETPYQMNFLSLNTRPIASK